MILNKMHTFSTSTEAVTDHVSLATLTVNKSVYIAKSRQQYH